MLRSVFSELDFFATMSRKSARESAFKLIYQIPFHTEEARLKVMELPDSYDLKTEPSESDMEYIGQTVNNCFDNTRFIDEKIRGALKNWTLERLPKVNLAILRLSLSEIFYGGIPYQVSINEAVELAKKFSDDDAPAFINGVLADIIKRPSGD